MANLAIKRLRQFHADERGHKRPVLSGIIMILGMLVASLMFGIFYFAGVGRLPGTGEPTSSTAGTLPETPPSWTEYEADGLSFRHPPEVTVGEETPGHQRQKQSMAEGYGYEYETGLRLETNGDLVASVTMGRLTRDQSRSEYYDYRKGIREGNDGLSIEDVTVDGVPALLFDRQSETVNTSQPIRSLDFLAVTDDRQYVEISSGTYSDNLSRQVERFKQILASLEFQ